MAKSSIHIEGGNFNFFRHNDRSRPTKNSIFRDEKNEYWNDSETAYKLWKSLVQKRSEKYQQRRGRKLHKKTLTHLSAIVNLNQHHKLDDLKPLARYLEQEFGARVVQVAIHRDEGHVDSKGNAVKNYHAHIEMVGIDEDGNSVRRKLDRGALIKLQSKTAELLGMERGTNYTAEQKPRPKRLGTYEYKKAKELEEQAKKGIVKKAKKVIGDDRAKLKDLEAENRRLRDALKQAHAKREQYALLEAQMRELRELARAKELTIEKMQRKIRELEQALEELKTAQNAQKEQNPTQDTTQTKKTAQKPNLRFRNDEEMPAPTTSTTRKRF